MGGKNRSVLSYLGFFLLKDLQSGIYFAKVVLETYIFTYVSVVELDCCVISLNYILCKLAQCR